MSIKKTLLDRVDYIADIGKEALSKKERSTAFGYTSDLVPFEIKEKFFSACLLLTLELYNRSHPYYEQFSVCQKRERDAANVDIALKTLELIKDEVDKGWLTGLKSLVSAEFYADFLKMAEELISSAYKDPAAVIIGSTLEEHLRQLCRKNNIETEEEKKGRSIPLRASRLNDELAKNGVYNKLIQKNVTASLDLRNQAAHGHFNEYTLDQVKLMLQSVQLFISQYPI
jgi:hypothetical protein